MPQYVYKCPKCQYLEEHIVKKYSDKIFCSKCGYNHNNKIPSAPTFILKDGGVGWGKDGYSK